MVEKTNHNGINRILHISNYPNLFLPNVYIVGGPATCQSGWLPETLAFVQQNNVALDFVSTHEYPTDITPTTRTTLRQVMTKARQVVGNRPLFYTEYNDGLWPEPLHDTIYASAFAIFNIIGTIATVASECSLNFSLQKLGEHFF